MKDYYKILNVPCTASYPEIQSAYKQYFEVHQTFYVTKEREYKNPKFFEEIEEAYQVLFSISYKLLYDMYYTEYLIEQEQLELIAQNKLYRERKQSPKKFLKYLSSKYKKTANEKMFSKVARDDIKNKIYIAKFVLLLIVSLSALVSMNNMSLLLPLIGIGISSMNIANRIKILPKKERKTCYSSY